MSVKKDLQKLVKEFKRQAKESTSRRNMRKLSLFVLRLIKERTRAGFGVKPSVREGGGRRFRFPPLSDSYIEQRERQSRRLSRFAFISKPNNTFTGRMLSDLRTTDLKSGGFSIGFKSRLSRKKAEFLAEMGREFLNLSAAEVRIIAEFYRQRVIDIEV